MTALPLLIAMAIFEAKAADESDAAFLSSLTKERVHSIVDASPVVRSGVWAAVERHQRDVAPAPSKKPEEIMEMVKEAPWPGASVGVVR